MAKPSPVEQLDRAIAAILVRRDAELAALPARLRELAAIADDLRGMPGADFKARLKADLQRRATMSTGTNPVKEIKLVRGMFHTVTPYLTAVRALEAVEFVKQAFGAEELFRAQGGAGGYHVELRLADSMLMMGGGGTYKGPDNPAGILLTVPDADAAYKSAMSAGATSLYEPEDKPYGDREAGVKDVCGNMWYLISRRVSEHAPEDMPTVAPGFSVTDAGKFVEFLKSAFGATEAFRHDAPDGTVRHARLRIGNSIVTVGQAHGQFQPMPSAMYMYVHDADAVYKRAIEAGATSMYPVANQPYGDRLGGVTDPFGHQWYIATNVKPVT
ncbi:MAG TPA: VOC family protein [Candidatus Acidoferrum sp.]|nr:VOC family protein [Candidatus Acidoferrum sp.]